MILCSMILYLFFFFKRHLFQHLWQGVFETLKQKTPQMKCQWILAKSPVVPVTDMFLFTSEENKLYYAEYAINMWLSLCFWTSFCYSGMWSCNVFLLQSISCHLDILRCLVLFLCFFFPELKIRSFLRPEKAHLGKINEICFLHENTHYYKCL